MTNHGQRILPGADLGREVPLPPQPPLEDERIDWSVCHCGHNADGSLMGYCAHCSSVRCDAYPGACRPPVESPDLPIPKAAIEAVAKSLYDRDRYGSWELEEADIQSYWRGQASLVLAAALPHLRSKGDPNG